MRILLLGATGTIGAALLDELTAQGHSVLALARRDEAARQLSARGIDVVRGDLRAPASWAAALRGVEGVIHAACTFDDDMGAVDRHLVETLIAEGRQAARRIRFVYTGGTWLYGATGDRVATEESAFESIPSFAWMIENAKLLLEAPCFETMIIHPAMVYERDGGAFARFIADARTTGRIEVWGSLDTRWPLVHRADLAAAYRLVLERGTPGQSYNAATQVGVLVGDAVAVLAERFGVTASPLVRGLADVLAEQGDWAEGPTLDQQMSGRKLMESLGWRPTRTDALAEIA